MGFNYAALDQSVAATRRAITGKECYLGLVDDRLVAAVVLARPASLGWPARGTVARRFASSVASPSTPTYGAKASALGCWHSPNGVFGVWEPRSSRRHRRRSRASAGALQQARLPPGRSRSVAGQELPKRGPEQGARQPALTAVPSAHRWLARPRHWLHAGCQVVPRGPTSPWTNRCFLAARR